MTRRTAAAEDAAPAEGGRRAPGRTAAALVLAAAAGVVVAGTVLSGGTPVDPPAALAGALPAPGAAAQAAERPLEQVRLACPALAVPPDGPELVSAFVLPEAPPGSGTLAVGPSVAPLAGPGRGTAAAPAAAGASALVTAEDGYAPAAAGVRSVLDASGEGRGLANGACTAPAAEFWFPGVAGTSGRVDELLLSNPTAAAAVVTLTVLGPTGPIEVPGAGVVVQPGATETIRIDSFIPDVTPASVQVAVTGGLVSAVVRSTVVDGLIPQGLELLQPAAPPAREVVVPGVAPGAGPRQLVIASPVQDVAATVELITADGAVPVGDGPVPVPAGFTVALALQDELQAAAGTVRVRADAPVTAAVTGSLPAAPNPAITGVLGRVPVADTAASAAAAPLDVRSVLPVSGQGGTSPLVVATALDGPAVVTLQLLTTTGPGEVRTLEIPAGTTQSVGLPALPEGPPAAVLLLPAGGSGRVYAALHETGAGPDGPFATTAVAVPIAQSVRVPVARPVPAAGAAR